MTNDETTEEWDFDEIRNTGHPYWRHKERTRSILTKRDREFLWGDIELEGQSRRNTQYKIRQRAIDGLFDFEGLAFRLPTKHWKKVLQSVIPRGESDENGENKEFRIFMNALGHYLVRAVRFYYDTEHDREDMRRIAEELEESFNIFLKPNTVEVTISYDPFETDETYEQLVEKLLAGEGSVKEWEYFIREWTPEVLIEEMEERDIDQFTIPREEEPDRLYKLEFLKNFYE